MIFEPDTKESETETRETPWPGGPRAIEQPDETLPDIPDPASYFDGSDLAEIDPNLSGLWPNEQPGEKDLHSPFGAGLAPDIPEQPADLPLPDPQPLPPELLSGTASAFESPLAPEDPQLPPRAWPAEETGPALKFVPETYIPESPDETVRRSGLAWSAGIVFFGAVAFMLFLGWIADLLFGTSPFGIVAGIVLGSMIGFIQFFRISKQIYSPGKNRSDIRSLMSHQTEDPKDDQ
ncbi:MAG: hypothetical protein AB7J13_13320 [Pyrinomonadaceae bacterium]